MVKERVIHWEGSDYRIPDVTSKALLGFVATLTDDGTFGKYYSIGTVGTSTAQSYPAAYISNLIQLTSTTFLLCFSGSNQAAPLYGTVITVSSGTVTFGAIQTVSASYKYPQLMYLSSTTALLMCWAGNLTVGAAILTISGTTVTMGTITTTTLAVYAHALDFVTTDQTNKRGILFVSGLYNTYTQVAIGVSVSGTTVTWGAAVSISAIPTNGYIFANQLLLDTNKVLLVYNTSTNSTPKYAVIITINSSNVITVGTPVTVMANFYSACYNGDLIKVSDTRVDYYTSNGTNGNPYHFILTLSGTSITAVTSSNKTAPIVQKAGFQFVSYPSGLSWPHVVNVSSQSNNVIIRDVCLDGDGYMIGLAKENKASGETVNVDVGDLLDGFSSLTAGALYYVQNGGVVSTNVSGAAYKLGVAISDTQMRRTA
jgi:hypothetical protein